MIMKKCSIYNGIESLSKKQIICQRSSDKKAVTSELQNFANSIEFAYKQLTATTSAARNAANAAKGFYKTAIIMVANCYPYQSATDGTYEITIKDGTQRSKFEKGALLTKTKDGFKVKQLKGRAAAGAVVAAALKNYIDFRSGKTTQLVNEIAISDILTAKPLK